MTPTFRRRLRPSTTVAELAPAGIGHNRANELRLQIEYLPVADIKLPHRQTRRHPRKQIAQIAAGMSRFGMVKPLIVDDDNRIVCGVGCFLAATQLGLTAVPVIRVTHLTSEELRFFALADNRLSEGADWDQEVLAVEIEELLLVDDIEIELTGFDTVEIEQLVLAAGDAQPMETEAVPEPSDDEPVSRVGDLFRIGDHLVVCGDARDPVTYDVLMGAERARMVFGDLPYNVKINGMVSGLGKARHREFMHASGEMTRSEFIEFIHDIMRQVAAHSMDGAIHYHCMDWRHQVEMMAAGEQVYTELKNMLVWVKTNAGMGAFYRSQHELIYAWKYGTAPHLNNFGLGASGRYRTNVLKYQGCNTFRKGRDEDLEAHSTVKPTELVADLIRDVSRIGDIVLDPCAGSGTTLLAAERVRRRARCIEIDPRYVDVIIRRVEDRLGLKAIHVETELDFSALGKARGIVDVEGGVA